MPRPSASPRKDGRQDGHRAASRSSGPPSRCRSAACEARAPARSPSSAPASSRPRRRTSSPSSPTSVALARTASVVVDNRTIRAHSTEGRRSRAARPPRTAAAPSSRGSRRAERMSASTAVLAGEASRCAVLVVSDSDFGTAAYDPETVAAAPGRAPRRLRLGRLAPRPGGGHRAAGRHHARRMAPSSTSSGGCSASSRPSPPTGQVRAGDRGALRSPVLATALGYGDRNWTPADLLAQIAAEVAGYGAVKAHGARGRSATGEGRFRAGGDAVTLLQWLIVTLRVASPVLVLLLIVVPLIWVERRGARSSRTARAPTASAPSASSSRSPTRSSSSSRKT